MYVAWSHFVQKKMLVQQCIAWRDGSALQWDWIYTCLFMPAMLGCTKRPPATADGRICNCSMLGREKRNKHRQKFMFPTKEQTNTHTVLNEILPQTSMQMVVQWMLENILLSHLHLGTAFHNQSGLILDTGRGERSKSICAKVQKYSVTSKFPAFTIVLK